MESDDERGNGSHLPSPILNLLAQSSHSFGGGSSRFKTYCTANPSLIVQRLELQRKLEGHSGCVNAVAFSLDGQFLFTGSDDRLIKLWDWQQGIQKHSWDSGHWANVFQARPIPASDGIIVSSAADGQIRCAKLRQGGGPVYSRCVGHHDGRAHKLALSEHPWTFLSCGEDGKVLFYDLRLPQPASKLLKVRSGSDSYYQPIELYTVAFNPLRPSEFCIGGQDEAVRVFDLRKASAGQGSGCRALPMACISPSLLLRTNRSALNTAHLTAAVYSCRGEILASYNDENIYLLSSEVASGIATNLQEGDDDGAVVMGRGDRARLARSGGGEIYTRGMSRNYNRRGAPSPKPPERNRNRNRQESARGGQGERHRRPPLYGRQQQEYQQLQPGPSRSLPPSESEEDSEDDSPAFEQQGKALAYHLTRSGRRHHTSTNNSNSNNRATTAYLKNFELKDNAQISGDTHLDGLLEDPYLDFDMLPEDSFLSRLINGNTGNTDTDDDGDGLSDMQLEDSDSDSGAEMFLRHQSRRNRAMLRVTAPGHVTQGGGSIGSGSLGGSDDEDGSEEDEEGEEESESGGSQSLSLEEDDEIESGESGCESSDHDDEQEEGAIGAEEEDYFPLPTLYNWPESVVRTDLRGREQRVGGGVLQCYQGHRNHQTIKGVNFFGADDEWVISGSDDGYIYFWDTSSGECFAALQGDTHVVNCLERHPYDVSVLATSGIDDDAKIWAATASEAVRLDIRDKRRMERNIEQRRSLQNDLMTGLSPALARFVRNLMFGQDDDDEDGSSDDDGGEDEEF